MTTAWTWALVRVAKAAGGPYWLQGRLNESMAGAVARVAERMDRLVADVRGADVMDAAAPDFAPLLVIHMVGRDLLATTLAQIEPYASSSTPVAAR